MLNVRGIPDELHRRVRIAAIEDGRSLKSVVIEALEQWLRRRAEEAGGD